VINPGEDILLIAEPFLKDENFVRAVVYICRHAEDGSFGFILNKPHQQTLDELITDLAGYPIPVYAGGPVQKDTIHFIHQYPGLIPGSYRVSDQVYWGGDFETVKTLIREGQLDLRKIKFFIGYSGWEKAQLENELDENSWILSAPSNALIFETAANDVWKASIKQLGGKYLMMANFPIDPQLN
jgi:putative transcriptional regulator